MMSGINLPRGPIAAAAEVTVAAPDSRSSGRAVVGAAREADVELLQFAVQVRTFETRFFRDLAHVALLAAEQLLEVDALERLARLAQRQLEETRRYFRREHLIRRCGRAKQPLGEIGRDVAAQKLHVRDDALQMIEISRPVRVRQRG